MSGLEAFVLALRGATYAVIAFTGFQGGLALAHRQYGLGVFYVVMGLFGG